MIPRVLEPEVVDSQEEARDYDAMDHSAVNARFCEDFLNLAPDVSRVLDVGTGTALIPIELCRLSPRAHVVGVDLSEEMLAIGRENVARAGLEARVELARLDAKQTGRARGEFSAVVSNSIVHHIPEPLDALREMHRLVAPQGVLFVRDLCRPVDLETCDALVDAYAPEPRDVSEPAAASHRRQRELLRASLRASLTVDEVREIAAALGIPRGAVAATSDRHWTLAWRRPVS
ncbi:MAG: class I SAM-dependent methyltransferase [Myxococcales bacterium]|nr:class I SAM-dependent methyltransferase [Myxococcales bacterium]